MDGWVNQWKEGMGGRKGGKKEGQVEGGDEAEGWGQ